MISVIMAVYNMNNKEILSMSISSILNQTYKNFELIVCDDASTDDTYSILKSIAKTDKRITLIRNDKNLRASGARNECLKIAKGRYIAIMDCDDYSAPERLQIQYDFLENNKDVSFVGGRGVYFNETIENRLGRYWFCKDPEGKDFLMTLPFVHASIMFRREELIEVGGYSTEKIVNRSEDYDLIFKLYTNNYRGRNLNEDLYYIRLDENTYKRRKYKYRINEAIVKYRGFKNLGLLPKGIFYVIKPLVVGIIPIALLNKIKTRYYKNKE